jgi:hypothetical protein
LPPAGCCWPRRYRVAARTPNPFTFPILDHTGQPVTWLVEQHEQPGHLIVVRRDHSGSGIRI